MQISSAFSVLDITYIIVLWNFEMLDIFTYMVTCFEEDRYFLILNGITEQVKPRGQKLISLYRCHFSPMLTRKVFRSNVTAKEFSNSRISSIFITVNRTLLLWKIKSSIFFLLKIWLGMAYSNDMHKIAKGKNHKDPCSNAIIPEKTQKICNHKNKIRVFWNNP